MSLKSRSRISADIRARHHIGIGLSVTTHRSLSCVYDSDSWIDAPDFYESSFWKDSDPASGLGGWGDPDADFEVTDGGFHTLPLSYPSPHTVRRNFTLYPFHSLVLFTNPQEMGNSSFSASAVETVLQASAGNYKAFQTTLEAPQVRRINIGISNMVRVFSS